MLRRIKTELRFGRYQRWHRHTTLQHPHWTPCWQILETGTAWAGKFLPQPHPSLTALCAPGRARALTTNHPLAEVERTSVLSYPGQNCSTEIPATFSGNLNSSRTKEDSTHCHREPSTKWCSELCLCREQETNTRRWWGTSSQWALILKLQWYWFVLFWFITLKREYHRAMNNNSFLHQQFVHSPPLCTQSQQATGNPREGKANLKRPRYALKFQNPLDD